MDCGVGRRAGCAVGRRAGCAVGRCAGVTRMRDGLRAQLGKRRDPLDPGSPRGKRASRVSFSFDTRLCLPSSALSTPLDAAFSPAFHDVHVSSYPSSTRSLSRLAMTSVLRGFSLLPRTARRGTRLFLLRRAGCSVFWFSGKKPTAFNDTSGNRRVTKEVYEIEG